MAVARNTDINLIIRARSEADRAVNAVSDALQGLFGDAEQANKATVELGKTLATLDKSAATLTNTYDKVSSGASKQAQAIHASAAAMAEQVSRVETLERALGILGNEANKAFVGPKRDGLGQMLKSTKSQLAEARKAVDGFSAAYERNLASLRSSRSSLLELGSATRTTAEAQSAVTAKLDSATEAYHRQTTAIRERAAAETAAAARGSGAQSFFNAKAGPRADGGAAANGAGFAALAAAEEIAAKREASQAYQMFEARVRSGVAAMKEADAVEERDTAEVSALRAALDPLAAIQNKYNASLERYRSLQAAGKLSTEELAAAEAHLATEAENARTELGRVAKNHEIGAFGLRPYELQNLGYQVNDVVTQLSSGTSLSQTLAQQGGQILQLFPKVGGAIYAAVTNPAILAFAAIVAGIAIALKNAADQAERLRQVSTTLSIRADGANYDAKNVSKEAEHLRILGASADDATQAVLAFLNNGVAPGRLNEFADAAQNASVALGIKLPDAVNEVSAAFTGGYEAVAKLDDKLNFLTGSQRAYIRKLFEEGKAQDARSIALDLYAKKMQDAAEKARGPWKDAGHSLATAWREFIDAISETKAIDALGNALTIVIDKATRAVDTLAGIRKIADVESDIKVNLGAQDDTSRQLAIASVTSPILTAALTQQLKNLKARYETLVAERNKLANDAKHGTTATGGNGKAGVGGQTGNDTIANDPNSPQAKLRADTLRGLNLEDELKRLRDKGQKGLTNEESQRREELAGQIAFNASIHAQNDEVVARRERNLAIAEETHQVKQQNLAARNTAISQFNSKVFAAEGGNKKNAAGSSADGYGQFTRDTYLRLYRQVYPNSTLNDSQALDTRKNATIVKGVLDAFTRSNAQYLERLGAQVTAGNLYLVHTFGQGPLARALLDPKNSEASVPDLVERYGGKYADQIKTGNMPYMYMGKKGAWGGARTAGSLRKKLADRVGDNSEIGGDQTTGVEAVAALEKEARDRQAAVDLTVSLSNQERDRQAGNLDQQSGLFGVRLIAKQREQEVDKAEFELRKQIEEQNKGLDANDVRRVALTKEQVQATRDATAALFDQQHDKELKQAKLADAQRPVDELGAQKESLSAQADFLRSIGDNQGVEAVQKQIDTLNPKLRDAIDNLIAFYKNLSPEDRVDIGILDEKQLDNIITKLNESKQAAQDWGRVIGISSKDIAQSFASTAASSVTNLIQKLSSGRQVFRSLADGVREFAATFIASIAQMILQLLAYAAAVAILRALGVPIPATTGVGVKHTGGVAGQSGGGQRNVNPMLFAGAMRYHTGGIAGLAPNEVPTILQAGEEVLTTSDPRHRANGGALNGSDGSNGPSSLKVVNAFDPASVLEYALSTKTGEKVLINHVRQNSRAYHAAIGA